jgi:hypothetical protein
LYLSFLHEHFAAKPQRAETVYGVSAALRLNVLRYQVIDRGLLFLLRVRRPDYDHGNKDKQETRMHMKLTND